MHVKTGYGGVGNVELNALQRVARVGLSLRLRSGLTADRLETWWKGTPVVEDGDADDGRRSRSRSCVRDPGLAVERGAAGARARARAAPDHARARGRAPAGRHRCSVRWPGEGPPARRHRPRAARGRERGGRRARDRRGPGPRRARREGRRRAARPGPPAARRRAHRGRHAEEPGGARADPPRRGARARHGGPRALPRDEDLDRPADRHRLLLRLRVPRRRQGLRGRLRAHRAEDARAREGGRAVRARGRPGPGRAEAVPRGGRGLQGRADRGPDQGRRGDGLALPQRPVHGPLPRPARARPPRR